MPIATRDEVRKIVDDLPDNVLDNALEVLKRLREESEEQLQAECDRRMLESGLLRSIPRPDDVRKPRAFKPIRLEGKPVSETLIEERR